MALLEEVEGWLPAEAARAYAIADDPSSHRTAEVLLSTPARPRRETVFQPKYAACLSLVEPWWKALRPPAPAGRRFGTWDGATAAIAQATAHWNAHRHPFTWGQRRRHRPRRQPGIALLPKAT